MVSDMNLITRNEFQQLSFSRERCFGIYGQTDPGRDAEDMGIDGHIGLVIDNRSDDVGGFAADAGEAHQFFDCQRNVTVKVMDQHLGHADQVFGFVIGIGNAANKLKQVVEIRFGQAGGVRIPGKNSRGRHVDPLIGALCRQDNRYQELVGAVIKQLRVCVRIVFAEIVQYELIALLSCHDQVLSRSGMR